VECTARYMRQTKAGPATAPPRDIGTYEKRWRVKIRLPAGVGACTVWGGQSFAIWPEVRVVRRSAVRTFGRTRVGGRRRTFPDERLPGGS